MLLYNFYFARAVMAVTFKVSRRAKKQTEEAGPEDAVPAEDGPTV